MRRRQGGSLLKGKAAPATNYWSHKFVCLDSTEAERVPTTQDAKMVLEEAGLGEKVVEVPMESTPDDFHEIVLSAFPKLKDGGGFELFRCAPNSRELLPIGPRVASTPKLVGNGRVYIRPLQRDLSLEAEDEDVQCVSTLTALLLIRMCLQ